MEAFFFGKEENMTVQKQFIKNIYIGNGSNKVFPFTFECPAEHPEFIHVYIRSNNELSETDNYTLSMEEHKVTYPVTGEALEAGGTLVIARELPLNQLLNLVNQGPFFAEDIEVTFDEVVMMIQQLNEKLGRTAAFGIDVENFDATLPIQAGYGWRVSDDGKSIVPLANPEGVYLDTVKVYEDTVNVKNETDGIKNAAESARDAAGEYMSEAVVAKDASVAAKNLAVSYSDEAVAAAQIAQKVAAKVPVYDETTEYVPGDVVMTGNGESYRCIADSIGENPVSSTKWVLTATVLYQTFETDFNGDLMVRYPPSVSSNWEIDNEGDIMVFGDNVLKSAEDVTW